MHVNRGFNCGTKNVLLILTCSNTDEKWWEDLPEGGCVLIEPPGRCMLLIKMTFADRRIYQDWRSRVASNTYFHKERDMTCIRWPWIVPAVEMWMKQEHCSAMTRDCQRNPGEKVVRLNQHKKGAPSMCAKSVGSRGSFSTIEGSTACHRRFSRSFEATARASTPWTFLICLWQNSIWKVAKDAAPCSSVFPEKKKNINRSINRSFGRFFGWFFSSQSTAAVPALLLDQEGKPILTTDLFHRTAELFYDVYAWLPKEFR